MNLYIDEVPDMKSLVIRVTVLLVLLSTTVHARQFVEQDAPPLEDLIREALENNPGLESSRYREMAVEKRIGQVQAWMPPELRYQYNRQALGTMESINFMNVNTYSLSQRIPFPGKISARTDVEQAGFEMAVHNREDYEVWLARQVKEYYYDLWMVQKQLDVNYELQDLLDSFVASAERMFEVGTTGLEAVLSAQTKLARLRTEERTLRNNYTEMQLMMNQLLDRDPGRELGEILSLPAEELPGTLAELEERLLNERPDILSMRSGIDMNTAEIKLAERNYYPDIMAGLMYMQMPSGMKNQIGFMASLQIPLAPWSAGRFTNKVDETRMELQSREKALENMVSMAQSELRRAILNLETQLDIIQLYREEVIPRAEETLESVSGSFRTGQTDYLMVLDSYQMLEMSRMEYYMAQAEFHKAVAELEQQTGIVIE